MSEEVVGVRFRPVTKIYYFGPGEFRDVTVNDPVIVETTRGEELGWVLLPTIQVPTEEVKGKLKPILRRATPVDLAMMEERRRTREAEEAGRSRDQDHTRLSA